MRRFSEIFEACLEDGEDPAFIDGYLEDDEVLEEVEAGLESYHEWYALWYTIYKYNGRHFKVVVASGHHGGSAGDDIEPTLTEVNPREVSKVIWEAVS